MRFIKSLQFQILIKNPAALLKSIPTKMPPSVVCISKGKRTYYGYQVKLNLRKKTTNEGTGTWKYNSGHVEIDGAQEMFRGGWGPGVRPFQMV